MLIVGQPVMPSAAAGQPVMLIVGQPVMPISSSRAACDIVLALQLLIGCCCAIYTPYNNNPTERCQCEPVRVSECARARDRETAPEPQTETETETESENEQR